MREDERLFALVLRAAPLWRAAYCCDDPLVGAGTALMDWLAVGWAAVVTTLVCIPLGISLWAFLDVARRPAWAWALAGRNQVVWLAVVFFGTFTVVGGLLISAWYLTRVRPAVAAVEAGDLSVRRGVGRSGPGGGRPAR